MHLDTTADEARHQPTVSTGELPPADTVRYLMNEAHQLYSSVDDGVVADYIPVLARARRDLFGLSVVGVKGQAFSVGDTQERFSIQSVSKPFIFALICEALGYEEARLKLGVNNTGMPFNSVMAIELNPDRTMNPMVNAGAIAATSLIPGADPGQKWSFVKEGLSRFAGRELEL